MSHRLDQRKPVFPLADRALVKRRKTSRRRLGFVQVAQQPLQGLMVILGHLLQAKGQAGEGQLVTRQHQLILTRMGHKTRGRLQPLGQRIGLRLGRINAYIGRNAGQKLIAADHQLVHLAPQRDMVRRMALAQPNPPAPPAQRQGLALLNPGKAQGHWRHHVGKVERPLIRPLGQHLWRRACALVKLQGLGAGPVLHIQGQHPRIKPSGAGGQKLGPPVLKPPHKAHMIGMMMREKNPRHRLARKGTRQSGLPDVAGFAAVHAGVDQRPAIRIGQRIDIHMVQGHRQRQAQPQDTLGHLYRRSGFGRGVKRKAQTHACNACGVRA